MTDLTPKTSNKIWPYFFWPLVFLSICWGIWIYDALYTLPWKVGVRPRELKGLLGIFTAPFLHKDFNHLINNTIPFLLLSSALFFFYKDLTYRLFFWIFNWLVRDFSFSAQLECFSLGQFISLCVSNC